jgi:hypothetical protein
MYYFGVYDYYKADMFPLVPDLGPWDIKENKIPQP